MPISAVDLFCGAGGLTCGLQRAGINVLAGIDFDGNCRYAFEHNNHAQFIESPIQNVNHNEIDVFYREGDIRVLVGCAPCQPFSTHANKIRKASDKKDDRWFLLNHFARLIRESHPEIISMENVPLLSKQDIFQDFLNTLTENGYFFDWNIVHCPQYGIPQNRHRLVLLASQYGEIKLIPPTHTPDTYQTVQNAIGELRALNAGESDPTDPLHKSSRLSLLNLKRIRQSKPGGTWRDWDRSLLAECHKKESGSTYSSVYARMKWDEPSPTITTQFYNYGTGRFGHPVQDRALSLREGALLQTFPPDYTFQEGNDLSFKQIGKMIGNAVPVRLGEVIGQSILQHLNERGIGYD